MPLIPDQIIRAVHQARKAIHRGDIDEAFKWTFIADRQTEIAIRLAGLHAENGRPRRHRNAASARTRKA